MNVLMSTFTILILSFCLKLSAEPFLPQPNIQQKNFRILPQGSSLAPEFQSRLHSGMASVNFITNSVKLVLTVVPSCSADLVCPTVLKKKIIELPIVSMNSDTTCFYTIQALQDNRADGGALEEITINIPNANCEVYLESTSNITFIRSFNDFKSGTEVVAVSNLLVDSIRSSIAIDQ